MVLRLFLIQIPETGVEAQAVRWRVHGEVRCAALDDVALLDAGKDISEEVVLTIERQPCVDRPRRSEEPGERAGADLVFGFGLREDGLRPVGPRDPAGGSGHHRRRATGYRRCRGYQKGELARRFHRGGGGSGAGAGAGAGGCACASTGRTRRKAARASRAARPGRRPGACVPVPRLMASGEPDPA